MNVLEASQYLVNEKLDVIIAQILLRFYNMGQVSFHQLTDYIYFFESIFVLWLHQRFDSNDVFML